MVWLTISSPYIHRSKIPVREERYLKRCIRGHLPFINKYHQNDKILFWPDLASSRYASPVLHCLEANNVSFVRRNQNPLNIPQCRLIEKIWVLIEQTVYQGGWEAKKFGLTVKSYQIENKANRSSYGGKHDSGSSRKTFENVSKRCLFCLLTFCVVYVSCSF